MRKLPRQCTGRVLVVDIVQVYLDRIHQQLLFRSASFMQGGSRLLGVKLPENALHFLLPESSDLERSHQRDGDNTTK